MIRIDEIWLATEPLDMRAGPDTALVRVVQVFGSARPHCAYLFANKRGNRMKVLIHDGLGIWLCARRLNKGKFHWGETWRGKQVQLEDEQLAALVQGLPWQRLGAAGVNTPFITQSSRREFMPHFGTLTASCHSVSRVVVQCYITQSSFRLFALPHSGC